MPLDDVVFAPATDLRRLIDSRQLSIVELTESFLGRIEALNPKLNAYLTVTGDEALRAAQLAEKALLDGAAKGPLHGIPISIKDLEVTKGIRSTMGSLVFKEHLPDHDSIVVERVRQSGAIILGKTNTPEFGFFDETDNRLGDHCRNPWDPDRTSGGSSGGAGAAVAGGLCSVATGSDGGGSIRIPASFCGVYGIKPSQGRVPRYGGVGRAGYNILSQSSPMTRSVRDAALLLNVLSGPDRRDPGCMRQKPPDFLAELDRGVMGLRLAWTPDLGYAAVDPEVVATVSRAAKLFEELGCSVEEPGVAQENQFSVFWDIFSAAGYTSYGHLLDERGEDLAEYTRRTLEHGRKMTAADYSRALSQALYFQASMENLFEGYDLLLTPTTPTPAFPVGEQPSVIGGRVVPPFLGATPFTFPVNIAGQPAASIPCGFSSNGMPIGLQIIGRRGEEGTVLRASAALEVARPWSDARPSMH